MIWVILIIMGIVCFKLGAAYMLLALLALGFKGVIVVSVLAGSLLFFRWLRGGRSS